MAKDNINGILQTFNLNPVIDHFLPKAEELVKTLLGIYKETYGENGCSYYFVIEALELLIKKHEECVVFLLNGGPSDNKDQIIHMMAQTIYDASKVGLKKQGIAEPKSTVR